VLEGHTSWLNNAAMTSNGRRAVTSSGDGTARLWDTRRWVG
jgi:WD40 repeat protein